MRRESLFLSLYVIGLSACSGGGDAAPIVDVPNPEPPVAANPLDEELRGLIAAQSLTGDPSTNRMLPDINSPLAQLGKKLFFTKGLGGDLDSACVSCHHPLLGGGDALSLAFGVGAVDPDLLGPGRGDASGVPNVPRNAPSTFNIGLWDVGLFWDSRIESLGAEAGENGSASGISTPDSEFGVLDPAAGENLVQAQARFPVTSAEEMRGALLDGADNDALRAHLAARIGDYGAAAGELGSAEWLAEFQSAFASSAAADTLVTFDNIALAIATYQRSQVFVDNPWRDYVLGDNAAISADAKRGAILFLTTSDDNGAGCVECHSGDFFTDERAHAIAAPQFGPGKGNANNNDFGRENISGAVIDRFRFRTPSLLNVAVTGPYMHSGAYESLDTVLEHYNNTAGTIDDFFDVGGWCSLTQFDAVQNCASLYPNAESNTQAALDKVNEERRLNDPDALPNVAINGAQRDQIVEFLQTLTDPCVQDRDCLAPWIPTAEEAVDDHQLNAHDSTGTPL